MIDVHSHTGFQPLKTCLVGQCYPPEFFNFIKDSRIRSVFEKIAEETEDDYQKLISILQQHQITVHRPIISDNFGMYLYKENNGQEVFLRPPMQPRDDMIVIGDKLYVVHLKYGDGFIDPWDHIINQIDPTKLEDHRTDVHGWQKIAPPCITRMGKDLYFDFYSHDVNYKQEQHIRLLKNNIIPTYFNDYKIHYVDCGGHSDGVFAPIVPGLIVTYEEPIKYKDSFPDWEIVRIPLPVWTDSDRALIALKKTQGRFWIKDHEFDQELTDFVFQNFNKWTGYSIETVFDVNLLMLDESNAIINSPNEIILEALSRRGITAHICAFRHRFFWDCGLHCATLDLYREGDRLDYFYK
jgi:N-dimethylarginine dimethylaminohydrolase